MEQNSHSAESTHSQPTTLSPSRTPWAVGAQERRLLPLSLVLAFLAVSALLNWISSGCTGLPGLSVTLLAAGWYAVLFLYRGAGGMERRINQVLMGAAALVALYFTVYSNQWFRFWNGGALVVLIAVHTWELCGGTRLPWHRAGMLFERLGLLGRGLFNRWGAISDTAHTVRFGRSKHSMAVLLGVVLTIPALGLVTAVLMEADAVFAMVAGNAFAWTSQSFGEAALRLILAVFLMPCVFSLLYFAAHTKQPERKEHAWSEQNSLPAVILLGALDALYLFFLAVQSAALFGDRTYLVRAGISYAEYARSGFFQLAGLAGLNAAVILAAVWLCQDSKPLRLLATTLVALTVVLLGSAAWRMTLYVSAYGLSFKRALTYWGMAMLAILLALVTRKVWRRKFAFFRAAAPIALAGWLVLCYANIDAITARYNAWQVERGNLGGGAVADLFYQCQSYDALSIFAEELEGWDAQLVQMHREAAARDCRNWSTWSLSAALAASGK